MTFSALLLAVALAQNTPQTGPSTAQLAPALPERVLLNVTDAPESSVVVTWRSPVTERNATVQFMPAGSDPRLGEAALSATGTSETVAVTEAQNLEYHEVRLTGLTPGTRYSYRVGDGTTWSPWSDFRTAQTGNTPFTFLYFGDAQNNIAAHWTRVVRQAMTTAPEATLAVHAGDLINRADNDSEWGEWFSAGAGLHDQVMTLAIPGNHEYTSRRLSRLWQPQFTYPQNGLPELRDTNFAIQKQGVLFIALNSNQMIQEQAVWLDRVLTQRKARNWTVVTFHHPVYSTAERRDNPQIRAAWQPIFERHKVDLVLQGHDHTYGRRGVNPVYVVSVSGPKMYRLSDAAKTGMKRVGEFTQTFQVIRVSPNTVRYESRLVTGELYDGFELVRNPDGRKVLREVAPQVSERRG